MVFKCPKCGSSLFHLEKVGNTYIVKCYSTKQCGWNLEAEEKTTDES